MRYLFLLLPLLVACADGGAGAANSLAPIIGNIGLTPGLLMPHNTMLAVYGKLSVKEGQTLNAKLIGYSPRGASITYSCQSGCNQVNQSLDATTGDINWPTMVGMGGGFFPMVFAADDGTQVAQLAITIYVNSGNQTPVINNIGHFATNGNVVYTYTPAATDPQGHALTYSITSGLPLNASWNGTTLTFTPSLLQGGNYQFDFKADNGTQFGTGSVIITVQ